MGNELASELAQPSQVDGVGIGEELRVGSVEQAEQHRRELGIGVVVAGAIGQPLEQRRQLLGHVGGERGEAAAQLRAPQCGDADLLEQDAAVAVGRDLEEEEVERPLERALGIEDVELRFQRPARVLDDLVDGVDQQVFLGGEVVMNETGGQPRLRGDALHRGAGESVPDDRRAQPVDDLAAARLSETGTTHE